MSVASADSLRISDYTAYLYVITTLCVFFFLVFRYSERDRVDVPGGAGTDVCTGAAILNGVLLGYGSRCAL